LVASCSLAVDDRSFLEHNVSRLYDIAMKDSVEVISLSPSLVIFVHHFIAQFKEYGGVCFCLVMVIGGCTLV
jgi:hypothetical protein